MHTNLSIFCSLDSPEIISMSSKAMIEKNECFGSLDNTYVHRPPIELLHHPLTWHHFPFGENFHVFHSFTFQLLRGVVPEKITLSRKKKVIQPVCIGQVNNKRKAGAGGEEV